VRGIAACERISRDFGLHMFKVARATSASVMRRSYDCRTTRSRRTRSTAETAVLTSQGGRIRAYELQGELVFGSVESLQLDVLTDLDDAECLVLDCKRVVSIDDSAARLLLRFAEVNSEAGKRLFFTGTTHLYAFRRLLQKSDAAMSAEWLSYDDTDRAIEACEQRLVDAAGVAAAMVDRRDIDEHPLFEGFTEAQLAAVRAVGVERRYPSGDYIVSIGDSARSFFFVLSGEAEVWVTAAGTDRRVRLNTLGPGTVFGEIGILAQEQRTANVTAATEIRCLEIQFAALSGETRERMLVNMARHFAAKLRDNTELLQHLA
jgi:glutaminase